MEIIPCNSYYLTKNGMWITILGDKQHARFCLPEEFPLIGVAFDPHTDRPLLKYSRKELRLFSFNSQGACKENSKMDIIGML